MAQYRGDTALIRKAISGHITCSEFDCKIYNETRGFGRRLKVYGNSVDDLSAVTKKIEQAFGRRLIKCSNYQASSLYWNHPVNSFVVYLNS